jgi:alkylation response protein AidB-like acyl-CoA dehydrogenase
MIRDISRKCAQEVIAPGAEKRDKSHEFPKAEVQELGNLGLLGMLVPAAYDGAEVGYLSLALAIEEVARADGAISTIMSVQNSLMGTVLINYGNEEQKQEFLKPLARGEIIGAFALTEPQAGSDAGALETTAEKDGDHYILNGTKQFITSGKHGDVTIVFAVTDKKAGKKGISAFIVPTNTQGYDGSKLEEKMGQHCSDTAQIVLSNCKVPAKYLIGKEGEGYKIALSNLEGGRIGIAAQSVGMAQAAHDVALQYAKERKTFGKEIIQHQAVAHRLADMATQIEAARLLVWQAAQMKDEGKPCLKEACMAKLFASEMAEKVVSDAIQTLGGYGYLQDFPLERIARDVRVCKIYEGTSDVQRIVIAKQLAQ